MRTLKPRPRIRTEESNSVIDIARGFNQVSEIALELAKLKALYQKKIEALGNLTEQTKEDTTKELARMNAQFVKEATALLNKSSITVLEEVRACMNTELGLLKSSVLKAEQAIDHAKTIQKGDKGDKGDDGVSPNLNEIANQVYKKIRQPKDGKDVNELEVVKKVVKVIYKMGLDIENIKGLEERLRHLGSKMMFGGGGGGQGSDKVKILSGDLDGSNTTFTYQGELPAEHSHKVMLNYQEQNPLTDYTVSSSGGTVTVTYTTAPSANFAGLPHYIRYR